MHINNLVFEGAGVCGMAYVGALEAVNQISSLDNVKELAGTSSGSIVATMLAVGYNISELQTLLDQLDSKVLKDDTFGMIRDFLRVLSNYGYFRGKNLYKWLDNAIAAKLGKHGATFRDLHRHNGKMLTITGTNLTYSGMVYFNFMNCPDTKIVDAIRVSISLPFIFVAPRMSYVETDTESKWVPDKDGNLFSDGGVMDGFPIEQFPVQGTLGLRVDYDTQGKGFRIKRLKQYAKSLLRALLNAQDIRFPRAQRYDVVSIKIPSRIESDDFDIGMKDKVLLVKLGYEQTSEYLRKTND